MRLKKNGRRSHRGQQAGREASEKAERDRRQRVYTKFLELLEEEEERSSSYRLPAPPPRQQAPEVALRQIRSMVDR
jgi:hypothetical protein